MPSTKQEAIGFLDPAIKEELFMRFWDSVGRRVRSFQSRGTAQGRIYDTSTAASKAVTNLNH